MLHHFIINPAAGKGRLTDALFERITRICTEKQVDFRIHKTTRRGNATAYVRQAVAEGGDGQRFYACGGDGTLCEVMNGAPENAGVEFAVIPIGTGNDFVRNFSSPEAFFDIGRQIDGRPISLDLIRYNDRYALNMLNIGFDCNVADKVGQIKRNPLVPSGLAYATGVGIMLCKPFGTTMHVTLADGTAIDEKLLLCAIANGGYCGGGFYAAPRTSMRDGLLDLCAIRKLSRATFLSLVGAYKKGTHLELKQAEKYIRYYQTPSLSFRFDGPINICVDGEIEMTDKIEISVVPHALSFSVPAGATLKEQNPQEGD